MVIEKSQIFTAHDVNQKIQHDKSFSGFFYQLSDSKHLIHRTSTTPETILFIIHHIFSDLSNSSYHYFTHTFPTTGILSRFIPLIFTLISITFTFLQWDNHCSLPILRYHFMHPNNITYISQLFQSFLSTTHYQFSFCILQFIHSCS